MFRKRSFCSLCLCERKVHLKARYQSDVKSPSSNSNSSKLIPLSIAHSFTLSQFENSDCTIILYAYVQQRKWTAKCDTHTIHEHSKLLCCVSVSTTHRFYRCLVLVECTINRFSIVFWLPVRFFPSSLSSSHSLSLSLSSLSLFERDK